MNKFTGISEFGNSRSSRQTFYIDWKAIKLSERLGSRHPDEELRLLTNEECFSNMFRYYRIYHKVIEASGDVPFHLLVNCMFCKRQMKLRLFPAGNRSCCDHCGNHNLMEVLKALLDHGSGRVKESLQRFNISLGKSRTRR